MLVSMVAPEFPPGCGGIGYYACYLSKALMDQGVQVEVIVRGGSGEGEYLGVTFKRISVRGLPPLNNVSFSNVARQMVRRRAPDLLHIHGSSMPSMALGIPEIVTSHWCIGAGTRFFYRPIRDLESLYRNLALPLYKSVERRTISNCARLTVVSSSMKEDYRSIYGVDSEVVHNAVDSSAFKAPAKGGKVGAPQVVFLGSLKRGKGVLDLLDAARLLNREFPTVQYRFVGAGPLKEKMTRAVRQWDLENIHLEGTVDHDDLPAILNQATALVLPSYYEGLPNSILEAMACGIPVVASRAKGNPEVVRDGETGYLFDPGDVAGLAESIARILRNPEVGHKMGLAGRKVVEREFTWETVAARFVRIYQETLRG
ncbi:glycosyltransferase family 4 protein [Gemmatimonadota bacterium]